MDIRALGQTIQFLRKQRGFSQDDLAKAACIARTTIARLEEGRFQSVSVTKLMRIAETLQLDLKTLFAKIDSLRNRSRRGQVQKSEFALDFSADGFRILSLLPDMPYFFFGKMEIRPKIVIPSEKLPHTEQICLHGIEGRVVVQRQENEYVLKSGDCFAFPGFLNYEFYNPDQIKPSVFLFITYPSFISI